MKTILGISIAVLIACFAMSSCAYARPRHVHFAGYDSGEIVARPPGCPPVLYCGCGVSVRVFGHSVRDLWLVSNWYRFPRASAAPGRVAIFGRRHVAYIESVDGDGIATLYDPNSGGGLTRIHRASIAGAAVVDPRGGQWATAR